MPADRWYTLAAMMRKVGRQAALWLLGAGGCIGGSTQSSAVPKAWQSDIKALCTASLPLREDTPQAVPTADLYAEAQTAGASVSLERELLPDLLTRIVDRLGLQPKVRENRTFLETLAIVGSAIYAPF